MGKLNKLLKYVALASIVSTSVFGSYSSAWAKNDAVPVQQSNSMVQTISNNVYQGLLHKLGDRIPSPDKKEDQKERKEILVKYKEESKADNIKKNLKNKLKLTKLEVKKKTRTTKTEILGIDDKDDVDGILAELKKDSNVLYAQQNYKLYTNGLPSDQRFNEQWGLLNNGQIVSGQSGTLGIDIHAVDAWNVTTGNPAVLVGVLDTGIDINHNDLKNNIYINTREIPGNGIDDDGNGYIDDVTGFDFVNNDSTVFDGSGSDTHGTHVAGIIAASANNEGISGVAPNVKLLPLKFIQGSYGYTSDAIEAIEYARSMGVKLVNCSWGGAEYNPALRDAMETSGMLFVNASGNNGADVGIAPIYPAGFNLSNALSITAVDNKGNLASFSNYGNTVDIAAPGVNILSTLPSNGYGLMTGTSMATPFVTGTAALLYSSNPNLSAQEVKAKLKGNATNLPQLAGKTTSGSIVNAYGALTGNTQPPSTSPPTIPPSVPTTGEPLTTYPFNFTSSIEGAGSVVTKFTLPDTALPYEKVQLIVNEKDKKNAVFNSYINVGQREVNLGQLPADTNFTFNVKIVRSDAVDSYVGQFIINLKSNPETNKPTAARPMMTVYKSPFNITLSVAQAVYMNAPSTQSVSNSVYSHVYTKERSTLSDTTILANRYEVESNDSFNLADIIVDDDDNYGVIGSSSDIDYYKVMFSSNGNANFYLGGIPYGRDYDLKLYDDTYQEIRSSSNSGNADEMISNYPVQANRWYYVRVNGYNGSYDSSSYYHLRAKNYATISNGDVFEPNDSFSQATYRESNSTTYANIHVSSDEDYYSINTVTRSNFTATLSNIPAGADYDLKLYNSSQALITSSSSGGNANEGFAPILDPGTYYIKVHPYSGYSSSNYKLDFTTNPILYAPQVSLTAPSNWSTYTMGQAITIAATGVNTHHMAAFVKGPTDTDYQWLTNQNGTNFSYDYSPAVAGTYSILVKGRNAEDGTPSSTLVESSVSTVTIVSSPTLVFDSVTFEKQSPQPANTTL
ncbi:S8 family serine peptidase, partial [Paenibacillus sp. WQ 127069]